MPISFPSSPTTNQTYTYNGRTWVWNGTVWQSTGTTGLISVTSPIVNSGTTTAAVLSLDTTIAATTTNTIALSNKTLTSPVFDSAARENIYTTATGFAGYTFYVTTNDAVQFITANATGNGTVNITSASGVTLNSIMSNNQSITIVLLITNGSTAYYPNAWQIDGTSITPKWQSGTAPSAGNASAVDIYTMTIIKTATNTYSVFGQQSKFA